MFSCCSDCIEEVCGQYGVLQCSLLRTLCSKVGVQLKLRNYDFLSTISPTFRSSDILNLFPIVKHVLPKANEGLKLLNKGQHCIQQGTVTCKYCLGLHLSSRITQNSTPKCIFARKLGFRESCLVTEEASFYAFCCQFSVMMKHPA